MPEKDDPIARLVEDRWRQFHAIVGMADSPDVCIQRVGQLLNQWYLEDAPLLFSATGDDVRAQWFTVQTYVQDLITSADPRTTLEHAQARWAQRHTEATSLPGGTTRAA